MRSLGYRHYETLHRICPRPKSMVGLHGIMSIGGWAWYRCWQAGKGIPLVSDTHKSLDFIEWLKIIDGQYPEQDTIWLVLDNHSAHTSKETQRYLSSRQGHFEFVFTPKHSSWLNLIESFWGKMARQFLREIHVNSKEELVRRNLLPRQFPAVFQFLHSSLFISAT